MLVIFDIDGTLTRTSAPARMSGAAAEVALDRIPEERAGRYGRDSQAILWVPLASRLNRCERPSGPRV